MQAGSGQGCGEGAGKTRTAFPIPDLGAAGGPFLRQQSFWPQLLSQGTVFRAKSTFSFKEGLNKVLL